MPPSCLHRGSTNLLTVHRHSSEVTLPNVRDKHPVPDLVNGNEQNGYGNRACTCQKHLIGSKAMKAKDDFTNARVRSLQCLDDQPALSALPWRGARRWCREFISNREPLATSPTTTALCSGPDVRPAKLTHSYRCIAVGHRNSANDGRGFQPTGSDR